MVRVIRKWETVDFEASKKDNNVAVIVELSLNRETGKFYISSPHQDRNVTFEGTSIEELELKLEAIKRAVKYVKENLFPSGVKE